MRWPWSRHKHRKGTTGKHARERRRHKYAKTCFQCGAEVTQTTKVAAHLIEQPIHPFLCFYGRAVLRTTCKGCNRRERPFWKCCVTPAEDDLHATCF